MQLIKPDSVIQKVFHDTKIFAAGSIELNLAENWQKDLEKELENYKVTVFNPRRDTWNKDWEQSITNPQFSHQVNWEMNSIDSSEIIFMYFDKNTKSPISLLELGYVSQKEKTVIVCCPKGFHRLGNVEIVCQRNNIPLFDNWEDSIEKLKSVLK